MYHVSSICSEKVSYSTNKSHQFKRHLLHIYKNTRYFLIPFFGFRQDKLKQWPRTGKNFVKFGKRKKKCYVHNGSHCLVNLQTGSYLAKRNVSTSFVETQTLRHPLRLRTRNKKIKMKVLDAQLHSLRFLLFFCGISYFI